MNKLVYKKKSGRRALLKGSSAFVLYAQCKSLKNRPSKTTRLVDAMCDREYSWEEVGYRDAHSSDNDCSQFHVVVYIFEFNDKNLE